MENLTSIHLGNRGIFRKRGLLAASDESFLIMNLENSSMNYVAGNQSPFNRMLIRVVPLWTLLCFLGWCYIYLSPEHSMDDADSEILNQSWMLVKHGELYAALGLDAPPYMRTPYTPIFILLSAAGLRFTGLSFYPAAFISLLGSLAIAGAFVYYGRERLRSWKWGGWAACLLFLVPAVLYNSVRSHPQMLAVALAVWGFIFFDKRRFLPTVVISPVLVALSIYTKQTMIALPIASLIWLLLKKREWLLYYLAVLSIAGLAPLVWLQQATGGNFWLSTVKLNKISYHAANIPLVLIHHAGPLIFFIILAGIAMIRRFRSGAWEPIDIYLASTVAFTVASCGGAGAYTQYVVELCIIVVLYVLCAAGVQTLQRRTSLVTLQLVCLLLYAPLYVALEHGPFALASRRASPQILALVRSDPGPMISQNGGFALFGTGQIYISMFGTTGLAQMGLWDGSKLMHDIENKKLRWVITQFDIFADSMSDDDKERFSPEVVSALQKTYALQRRIGPYYIYR